MNKDEELTQVEYFIDAYNENTGKQLSLVEQRESPDFLCQNEYQEIIGVELCRIVRNSIVAHREIECTFRKKMDYDDADIIEIMCSNIIDKEEKRHKMYSMVTNKTILVLSFADIPITNPILDLTLLLKNEFPQHGFSEIWLADYTLLDSHSDIRLFNLFPFAEKPTYKGINPDIKPYG